MYISFCFQVSNIFVKPRVVLANAEMNLQNSDLSVVVGAITVTVWADFLTVVSFKKLEVTTFVQWPLTHFSLNHVWAVRETQHAIKFQHIWTSHSI